MFLGIVVLVIFVLAFVGMVIGLKVNDGSIALPSGGVFLVLLICYLVSGSFHVRELAVMKHEQEYLANKEQRIASLKETVALLSDKSFDAALVNHDQPVSELMKAIADAERSRDVLAHSLIKDRRMNDTRKMGVFGAVTWFLPEAAE